MRVIIDVNVYLSAICFGSAKLRNLISFCFEFHQVVVCEELMAELKAKIEQKSELNERNLNLVRFIESESLSFNLVKKIKFERDPKDAYLLSLCNSSEAEIMITGDKDLLDLGEFENTKIFSPRDFIDFLKLD